MLGCRGVNHMREFVKSSFSLGIALSLLTLKQTGNLFTASVGDGRSTATRSLEAVSKATVDQLGGTLKSTFSALDNAQRGLVEIGFAFLFPPIATPWSIKRDRRSDAPESMNSKNGHVFNDDVAFDEGRATILRSRKARDDERFHDRTTEILVQRRS